MVQYLLNILTSSVLIWGTKCCDEPRMDLNIINKYQTGLMNPNKFKTKFNCMIGTKLYESDDRKIFDQFQNVYDVDLMDNKTLVTTDVNGFHIYNVDMESISEPFNGYWNPRYDNYPVGLPCATWGEHCSFIMASGCGNSLAVLDTSTFQVIEEISLDENTSSRVNFRWSTMGHDVCPYSNKMVAVACSNGMVPLIDLRTGSVESIVAKNLVDVNTVIWSQFCENIIALTSGISRTLEIWDIRNFRQHCISLNFPSDTCPDIKFLNFRSIIGLRDTAIEIIDIFKEETIFSQSVIGNTIRYRRKNRIAINYNSKPQLVYFPIGEKLCVLQINDIPSFTTTTSNNNLFAIEIIVLNENLQEIYTFNDVEVLIWRLGTRLGNSKVFP